MPNEVAGDWEVTAKPPTPLSAHHSPRNFTFGTIPCPSFSICSFGAYLSFPCFQCIVLYSTEPQVLLTDKGLFRKPDQGHFPGSKTTVRLWWPNCRIFARAAAPWTARCPAEGSWYPWDGQVTPPQTSWHAGAWEQGWFWDLLTISGGTGWSRGGLLNSYTFHFNARERRAGFSHERIGTCQCCRSCF